MSCSRPIPLPRTLPALLFLLAASLFCAVNAPAAPAVKLPAVATPKVEWTPVYYKGRSYVPLDQVAAYYDLRIPEVWNKAFALRREKLSIELALGEKRVRLNGWTFFFSFPVVKQPEKVPMISVFDVRNVLDPILRPTDRRDPAILRTVIIDPAGGGRDPGIQSQAIDEKELTLELAKVLATLLKNNGYKVVLTRETDKLVLPAARVRMANEVTEESVYLNLRAATSSASATKGFECSTLPPAGTPATNESDSPDIDKRFFAGNISDRESLALATTVQNSVVSEASTIDLGVRRVRVDELRDLRMPAISCKLGYLSNKDEAKKLASRDYRDQLALAILHGVDRYAGFLRRDLVQRAEEDRKRPLRFGPVTVKEEIAGMKTATETVNPDRSEAEKPTAGGTPAEPPEEEKEKPDALPPSQPQPPVQPPSEESKSAAEQNPVKPAADKPAEESAPQDEGKPPVPATAADLEINPAAEPAPPSAPAPGSQAEAETEKSTSGEKSSPEKPSGTAPGADPPKPDGENPAPASSGEAKPQNTQPEEEKPASPAPEKSGPESENSEPGKPAADKPDKKEEPREEPAIKRKSSGKKSSSKKTARKRSPGEEPWGKKAPPKRSPVKKPVSKPAEKPIPAKPAAPASPGDRITLRLPIVASGVGNIDRSQVELQIFLFESVNDGEIDLTTSNPPETKWISVLPDWKAGVPEWFQVSYLRPPFNTLEEKQYGKRSYYGYVARLIYAGRLMDETAYPPNLNRCLYYFTPVFPRR
ncbi:MAG: N-acetylmuramoyl-L-alanine amidase [Verrucomicrobiota bacterium]